VRCVSCGPVYMANLVSYAQALRVIGQNLGRLGINAFELAKSGDDYVVWIKHGESARHRSATKTFFNKISQNILRHADSDRQTSDPMHFSNLEIFIADIEQQSKRRPDSQSDVRDLSFVLRVLGDYLDRQSAREFTISWSMDSIKVRYDQREESFTFQSLYDLGIHMYLKRSNRRSPI